MKEKIEKIFKDGTGVIIILFVLQLILMFFVTPNKYDDEVFLGWIAERNVSNIVSERYFNWTSRVIIEYTLLTVLKISKYAWIFLEAGMVALLGYSISEIFVKKEYKKEINILLLFLILAYPMNIMGSAGWAATTTNYMWPLATAMFALIPIKKAWNNEKMKWYMYPLYAIALLYACNQEQACAIVCGAYLVFTTLLIIRDKKIHPFVVVQTVLAVASIIFILTAPGNYVRKESEMISGFKDYEMINFQDKISLGFTTTLGDIIEQNDIPFTILTLVIAVYIFMSYKEKIYRIVALIPLMTMTCLGILSEITFNIFPLLGSFRDVLTSHEMILTAANCNNFLYVLPIIFSMIVFMCIVLSILLIFKNLKDNLAVFVFLVGFASRLIMGFSPSVFMSSIRTIFFFDFSMLIVSLLICQEFLKKTDKAEKKVQRRTYAIIEGIGVLQYLNVLITILLTQK